MDKAYADTVRLLLTVAPDVFANFSWMCPNCEWG